MTAKNFLKRSGRFELKYIISRETEINLLEELRYFMQFDDNCIDKGFYENRSLYFDTASFRDYHEYVNGEKRRRKVRVRKYNLSNTTVNLEIKNKLNKIVWKDKISNTQQNIFKFIENPWVNLNKPNIDHVRYLLCKRQYEAKCTVVYKRVALSDIMGAGVRITFDSNIYAGPPGLFDRAVETNECRVLPPGITIMEIKFNRFVPNWLAAKLRDFSLSYTTYSKYVVSCDRFLFNSNLINR